MAKQRFDDTQTGGEGITPQVGADSTITNVGKTGAEDVSISNPVNVQEETKPTQKLDPNSVEDQKTDIGTNAEPEPIQPNVIEDKQPEDKQPEDKQPEVDTDKILNSEVNFSMPQTENIYLNENIVLPGSSAVEYDNDYEDAKIVKTLEDAQKLREEGYSVFLDGVKQSSSDGTIKNILFTRGRKGFEMKIVPDEEEKEKPEEKAKTETKEERNLRLAPKGGIEFDGRRFYKFPAKGREKTLYVIENGNWFRLNDGEDKWQIISEEENVKALNNYHGTDAKVPSAWDKPVLLFDDSELGQAGKILHERGVEFGGRDVEGADVEDRLLTEEDLVGGDRPSRPSLEKGWQGSYEDLLSAQMDWDIKYGDRASAVMRNAEEIREKSEYVSTLKRELEEEMRSDGLYSLKEAEERKAVSPNDPEVIKYESQVNQMYEDKMQVIKDEEERLSEMVEGYELEIQSAETAERFQELYPEEYMEIRGLDPYLIREMILHKTYGMYDEGSVDEFKNDMQKFFQANNEISRQKINEFVNRDIDSWASEGRGQSLNDVAVSKIKEFQSMLRDNPEMVNGDNPSMLIDYLAGFVEEAVEQQRQMNQIASSGENMSDWLTNQKRSKMDDMLNGKSDFVSEEVKSVFQRTMAIRDIIDGYAKAGKIKINRADGSFEFTDNVGEEEKQLINQEIENAIQDYSQAKLEIFSSSTQNIKEKQVEISKIKSEMYAIESRASSNKPNPGDSDRYDVLSSRVSQLEDEIETERLDNNTILLNDPEEIAQEASEVSTRTARDILNNIDPTLTPKEKFDLFYNRLLSKTEMMADLYNIDKTYASSVIDKLKDIADWRDLGFNLSPEAEEYYKNMSILRKLAPVYFNNDWGVTDVSSGFWDSFMNSFIRTFSPTIADAEGFYNETEMLAVQDNMIKSLGLTDKSLSKPEMAEAIKDRLEVPFFSNESWGGMLGTTTAFMTIMMGTGAGTTTAIKGTKAIISLFDKYKDVRKVSEAVKDFNRLDDVFNKTLGKTKLGSKMIQPTSVGLNMEISGRIVGSTRENMSFEHGFLGCLAGKGVEAVAKKIPVKEAVDYLQRIFGSSTGKAVDVIKSFGAEARNYHYMGTGELFEETMQDLVTIYNDELRSRGFWDEVATRYGDMDYAFRHAFASYFMGVGFGIGADVNVDSYTDGMSEEDAEVFNELVSELAVDFAEASAATDVEANKIKAKYDNQDKSGVSSQEQVGQESIEADTKQGTSEQEAEDGRMVQEEQAEGEATQEIPEGEIVRANSLEEAQRLWDEGYRPDGVDSRGALEGMFATGRPGIDMRKPLPKEEAKVVSMAERAKKAADVIRSEKTTSKDAVLRNIAASSIIPPKIWDMALEGLAYSVETIGEIIDRVQGSEWYKGLTQRDKARMSRELFKRKNALESAQEFDRAFDEEGNISNDWATEATLEAGLGLNKITSGKLTSLYKKYIDKNFSRKNYEEETGSRLPPKTTMADIIFTRVESGAAFEGVSSENVVKFLEEIGVTIPKQPDKTLDPRVEAVEEAETGKATEGRKTKQVSEESAGMRRPSDVKEEYDNLKKQIAEFKKIFEEGFKTGKKEGKEKAESKAKEKEARIEEMQKAILDFAKEFLPKQYRPSKTKLTAMMNSIRTADSSKKADKAMQRIVDEIVKFEENSRKKVISDIVKMITDKKTLLKKSGNRWKGKIPPAYQQEFKNIIENINVDSLSDMTIEEATALYDALNNAIEGGKVVQKELDKAKSITRKYNVGSVLEAIHDHNTSKGRSRQKELKDSYEIREHLKSGQPIMFDGMVFTSNSALDAYLKDQGISVDDISNIGIKALYLDPTLASKLSSKGKWFQDISSARRTLGFFSQAPQTLENRLLELGKNIPALREYTDALSQKIDNALYDEQVARAEKVDAIVEKLKDIFDAKSKEDALKKASDFSSKETIITMNVDATEVKITYGQLVSNLNKSKQDAKTIYIVGSEVDLALDGTDSETRVFSSQDQALEYSAKTGFVVQEAGEYNPGILRQLGDANLTEGYRKIKEMESYLDVEGDVTGDAQQLKDYKEVFPELYKEFREDYNPLYTKVHNREMNNDGTYVPLRRARDGEYNRANSDSEIMEAIAGNKDGLNPVAEVMSNHLKDRKSDGKGNYDIYTDPIVEIMQYVSSMEHTKALMPVAEAYTELINPVTSTEIAKKLGNGNVDKGSKKLAEMNQHMSSVLSGDAALWDSSEKIFNTVLQLKVIGTLALKWSAIPKQLTSFSHFIGAGNMDGVYGRHWAMATGKILSKGAVGMLTDQELEVIKSVWQSPFVKERLKNLDLDVESRKFADALANEKITVGKLKELITKYGMFPTKIGDIGGVLIGGTPFALATYNKNVNDLNMSHEEAMDDAVRKFVKAASKTQQSTRSDILSNYQRSKLGRVFSTFTTSQVAAMANVLQGYHIASDASRPMKERVRGMQRMLYYSVANALFTGVASGAFATLFFLDEDDESVFVDPNTGEKKKIKDLISKRASGEIVKEGDLYLEREMEKAEYDLIMGTIQSNLDGLGVTGKLANWAINIATDKKAFNNIPLIDMIFDIAQTVGKYGWNVGSEVAGGSPTLEAIETSFNQETMDDIFNTVGVDNAIKIFTDGKKLVDGDIDAWTYIMGSKDFVDDKKEDMIFNAIYGHDPQAPETNLDEYAQNIVNDLEVDKESGTAYWGSDVNSANKAKMVGDYSKDLMEYNKKISGRNLPSDIWDQEDADKIGNYSIRKALEEENKREYERQEQAIREAQQNVERKRKSEVDSGGEIEKFDFEGWSDKETRDEFKFMFEIEREESMKDWGVPVGATKNGYRYKGGYPGNKNNWEKISK